GRQKSDRAPANRALGLQGEVRCDALPDPRACGGAHRAGTARGEEQRVPDRRGPRGGDAAEESVSQPREISGGELLLLPDFLAAWIRMERLTRRAIGRRMEDGPTRATDAALDRLIGLRAWLARRLVN